MPWTTRRLAVVSVPMDLLGEVLHGTLRVWGFPADAKFIRALYNMQTDSIDFLLEHPSFQEVQPGEHAPVLNLGVDYVIT